jgi:hypothetical protein
MATVITNLSVMRMVRLIPSVSIIRFGLILTIGHTKPIVSTFPILTVWGFVSSVPILTVRTNVTCRADFTGCHPVVTN